MQTYLQEVHDRNRDDHEARKLRKSRCELQGPEERMVSAEGQMYKVTFVHNLLTLSDSWLIEGSRSLIKFVLFYYTLRRGIFLLLAFEIHMQAYHQQNPLSSICPFLQPLPLTAIQVVFLLLLFFFLCTDLLMGVERYTLIIVRNCIQPPFAFGNHKGE